MPGGCVITIGNFDGVHLGHQSILARARQLADEAGDGVGVRVVTFHPHPTALLRPEQTPLQLMALADRKAALTRHGADDVRVLAPTRELLALEPAAFIDWLGELCPALAFVEGEDFRFGRDRRGDVAMLGELGRSRGFTAHVVREVDVNLTDYHAAPVSSTLIRRLLLLGRVADATRCLGQPYRLGSVCVPGQRRGRALGFATANLDPAALQGRVIPADGVYAGSAKLDDGSTHLAAISIGHTPTFAGVQRVIEAHLLDLDRELYGQTMELSFAAWLRAQSRFPNVEALLRQLDADVQRLRLWARWGLVPGTVEKVA